jgi:hypothetical protein
MGHSRGTPERVEIAEDIGKGKNRRRIKSQIPTQKQNHPIPIHVFHCTLSRSSNKIIIANYPR